MAATNLEERRAETSTSVRMLQLSRNAGNLIVPDSLRNTLSFCYENNYSRTDSLRSDSKVARIVLQDFASMSINGILDYEEGVPNDCNEFMLDDAEEEVSYAEFSVNPPQAQYNDKESFARILRWLRWKI